MYMVCVCYGWIFLEFVWVTGVKHCSKLVSSTIELRPAQV